MFRPFVLIIASIFISNNAFSAGFYDSPDTGKRGWYNYEVIEQEPEETEEETLPEKQSAPIEKSQKWPTYDEALKLSTEEINALFKKATNEAVSNPTEENVLRFVEYKAAIRVKADEFTQVTTWVQEQHPEYNYYGPGDTPASSMPIARYTKQEELDFLIEKKDDFALLVFIDKDAPTTEKILGIMERFIAETAWNVKIVNAYDKPKLAVSMGIKVLPQAVVISKDNKIAPFIVATGLPIKSKLLKSIHLGIKVSTGETDLKNYMTRPAEAVPFTIDN